MLASISRSNFTFCQFVRLTSRLSDLKHLEQLKTVLILAEWLEKTVQKGHFLQMALKPGLKNKFADKIALKKWLRVSKQKREAKLRVKKNEIF